VWDGFAYDPRLKLVYFGTANAAPYDLRQLGPAQADGLYAASIIALRADTGRMAWYYQTTPGDKWDFDATQKLILTELQVGDTVRSVILQANKNGFFYVLDRRSGALLSAQPFVHINWASGVDLHTGRPVTTEASDWYEAPANIYPSPYGAHTWSPMSYSAQTHLVYVPVIDAPAVWVDLAHNGGAVKYIDGIFTANAIIPDDTYDAAALKHLFGPMPGREVVRAGRHNNPVRELIRAWDPVARKIVWEHETSAGIRGYDGGIASTGGNLVRCRWVTGAPESRPAGSRRTVLRSRMRIRIASLLSNSMAVSYLRRPGVPSSRSRSRPSSTRAGRALMPARSNL
jgi:quinohemoprotein ethanol dehydrogenase